MAYIHAETLDDAMRALGYITAQDRLFQMTLTRLFAEGRICELAGEMARDLDIRHRTSRPSPSGHFATPAFWIWKRAVSSRIMLTALTITSKTAKILFRFEFKLAGIVAWNHGPSRIVWPSFIT